MHKIETFLEVEYAFTRTDWGFLNRKIENVEYTLLHDPFNGYFLQYQFITKRTAGSSKIPLGKDPTIDDLYNAFEKILR